MLLVALAASGCGGGSSTTAGPPTAAAPPAPAETVSLADISEEKPGGPEQTVLRWWRYVQLNDPKAAQALYATEPTLPNLAGQFNVVTSHLHGKVTVVSTKERGNDATVTVSWRKDDGSKTSEIVELEELNGEWKISGAGFLDELAEEFPAEEG